MFMRNSLGLLLIATVPLVTIAATCVTNVRENSPTGPWVGEIVNTGDTAVSEASVEVEVVDATGHRFQFQASVCPSRLEPGQVGTWEIFPWADLLPPVRIERVNSRSYDYDAPLDHRGLSVNVIETNAARRNVVVEIENGSFFTYQGVLICGNLRTRQGKLAEVGSTVQFPYLELLPGERRTKIIYFNTMPDGDFEFFALGVRGGSGSTLRLPPDSLRIVRTQVRDDVNLDPPFLEVFGELTNPLPVDLSGVLASAYVSDALDNRNEEISLGCGGVLGADETVAVHFVIPLPEPRATETLVIEHIGAILTSESHVRLPVADVRYVGDHLVADVSNPTDTGLRVNGVCLAIRRGNELIDAYSFTDGPYLPPGETVEWRPFQAIPKYPNTSFELIVYGQPSPPPIFSPLEP